MTKELAKNYDAPRVEAAQAARWQAANAFHAEPGEGGDPYVIVIPPPNVTAALHLGHALNNTLQDVLIRWRRMAGDNAVWLPGTDHAGIATQTVVEKRVLAEEGRKRTDFQRDEFVARIQAWKDEYEQRITEQLKAMGCSCDWQRQAFTMDDTRAKAVREAFFQLFKDGLIYRGKRLVNWDPATQTALADDEVEMEEVDGHFWYMRYPIVDDHDNETGEFATVATTRPETMLGDTAVAVNPNDEARKHLIGRKVRLPIVNRIIPIVGDDYVVKPDPESSDEKARFASGFLKVTPAHDPNDYEIGQRHDLPIINVMAPDGTISKDHAWLDWGETEHDEFLENLIGMDRYEAREAIVEWFGQNELLAEVKPYRHTVGHSYRSHVAIEPYLSDQWYVKVTDDRLAGAALRAMAEDQRSEGQCVWTQEHPFDAPTSRARQEAVGAPMAYLITWGTYGARLHGDSRGSIHHQASLPGEPVVVESPGLSDAEADAMSGDPFSLDAQRRAAVRDVLAEVCEHRGWRLLAANVRTDHVHVALYADATPERVMNDFKSYATRRLREQGLIDDQAKVWARHGSTRYLSNERAVAAACEYVIDQQGEDLGGTYRWDTAAESGRPLPHGRGSYDGALRFTPARYAKTFQMWHENIRDWCISRQLWWGHRIPVWSRQSGGVYTKEQLDGFFRPFNQFRDEGRLAATASDIFENAERRAIDTEDRGYESICIRDASDTEVIEHLESHGFVQDPDVLDTWFSSALWPMSTLGWPEETDELKAWNPTSVLSTAREIITLWVSRMVMFNCYFRGCVPFTDVFIHAMIQDGEGRKMSKSLGNGVDPLDIIHTHGADAMRFTLTLMTTQTQDVRMPVERVPGSDRNTSPKFDIGRNFCNKLWNAGRFAMGHLGDAPTSPRSSSVASVGLVDRWICSRLARTVAAVDEALGQFQFNAYTQAVYDFFWRDLCDWYLEAIKPVVREDSQAGAASRGVLAACLDAVVRMLHPVTPFITEAMFEQLNAITPDRSIDGVKLAPSALCLRAAWPTVDPRLIDPEAEQQIELLQQVVTVIRDARNTCKIPPRQKIGCTAKACGERAALLGVLRELLETLAMIDLGEIGPDATKPDDAATSVIGDIELYLAGMVDPEAERRRLTKRLEELTKNCAALSGRLNNKGYTDKAPAHLVQQTRDQLADAEKEMATVKSNLEALGE